MTLDLPSIIEELVTKGEQFTIIHKHSDEAGFVYRFLPEQNKFKFYIRDEDPYCPIWGLSFASCRLCKESCPKHKLYSVEYVKNMSHYWTIEGVDKSGIIFVSSAFDNIRSLLQGV